jgi:transcriptional regulator with XRE-family HTH domain
MKNFRIKHGYSQRKLAKLMKVSRGSLSCWELGLRKPCFKSKLKIYWFYIKFYLGVTR